MGEIGFPGEADLPGMGGRCVGIGFAHERLFRFRRVGGQSAQDVLHRQGEMGGGCFNGTHGLFLWGLWYVWLRHGHACGGPAWRGM